MKFDTVLVDADSLLYSVGFATQKNIYKVWVQGHQGDPSFVCTDKRWLNRILKDQDYELHKYLFVQPFFSASTTIDKIIEAYKKKFKTKNIRIYFTGKDNFRDNVATIQPYKGNRDSSNKPEHYEAIKAYMVRKHNGLIIDGQEADDEVSIQQTLSDQGKSVIVSIDKDLMMVEGYHYNPNKDALTKVTKLEGLRWFYEQLLQGDSTDNIPGIKGIGKVTAKKLLENCTDVQELESVVMRNYMDYYREDAEKYIVEVGQLLWMRLQYNQMWYPEFMGGCKIESNNSRK